MSKPWNLKAISTLTLLLLTVSSVSPFLSSLVLPIGPVGAVFAPAVQIQMVDGFGYVETVWFADHSSVLASGNWVELSGGTAVTLPSLEAQYNGIDATSFTKNGKDVDITSTFTTKTITYPLTTHQIYMAGDTITADFTGEDSLAGLPVDFVLMQGAVSDWKAAYTDLMTNADITKLKDLVQNPVVAKVSTTFDLNGDATADLTAPAAGDYVLGVLSENDMPGIGYELWIFSATPVEVIDYDTTAVHATSLDQGDNLGIAFTMTAPASATSYRYGAVMIRQAAYDLTAKFETDGTLANTNLLLNDVLILEGTGTIAGTPGFNFVGFDLNNIDTGVVTTEISDIFGANNVAVAFSNPTTSATGQVSLHTSESMTVGTYIVLAGVWEASTGNKLVAFKQSTVTLNTAAGPTPTPTPTTVTVEQLESENATEAAKDLEGLTPKAAADLLVQLNSTTAAAIIAEMNVTDVVDILLEADPTAAAAILDDSTAEETAAIVKSVIDSGRLNDFVQILIDMEDTIAADVLYVLDPNYSAALVEAMASRDLTDAASTTEDYVKLLKNDLDAVKKLKDIEHLNQMFDIINQIHRVRLLISIANLQNTPSTVAYIFEIGDFARVMDDVTGMGEAGAWSELGKVFSFLTPATLNKIYTAMTEEQRASVSPYLTAATVSMLPKLGTFSVSDLSVSSASVKIGDPVTISVKVTNTGASAGSYDVVLKINSSSEQTKTVSLNAGASTTVTFTVTKSVAGSYSVVIDTLTGSFTVKTPAAFTVSNLQVSKTEVDANEAVTVTVTVSNTGETSGSYTLSIKLDNVEKFSEAITLDGKASVTKTYSVSSATAGTHTVTADGLTVQFTVKTVTPPPTTPDYTWYIIGGVVVVIAVVAIYFLFIKKK